jgi:lipopolysaccharide transport system permease protein
MSAFESYRREAALVGYKAYAGLRTEIERTRLGALWWVLEPVVSMTVYYVVFSVILKRGGPDYVSFLFVGIIPWRWFQATVQKASKSLIAGKRLMLQVDVPKRVFPSVAFLEEAFKTLIVFVLLLIFLAVIGEEFGRAYIYLPFVIAAEALLIAALAYFFASITPFAPDIALALANVLRLLFFLSGIFYNIARFPPSAQNLFRLNPMAVILESLRAIMLNNQTPDLARLTIIGACSAALLALSLFLLSRWSHEYPKLKI